MTFLTVQCAQPPAIHVADCKGDCGGTYICDHCHRECGWCFGAYDEIEREHGPICDECALEKTTETSGVVPLEQACPECRGSGADRTRTSEAGVKLPCPKCGSSGLMRDAAKR